MLQTAPANQSSVVAGAYRATWGGLDIGLVDMNGFDLRYGSSSIDIQSDITGETVTDSIHTGIRPTITMTLQHWNAQAVEAMTWWFGTLRGFDDYQWGETDGVGLNEWEAAQPLILTACHVADGVASQANPTIDPLSIIIYKTILQSDADISIALSHRPRFITVPLKIMPVNVDGSVWPNVTVSRVSSCGSITYWNALRNVVAQPSRPPNLFYRNQGT